MGKIIFVFLLIPFFLFAEGLPRPGDSKPTVSLMPGYKNVDEGDSGTKNVLVKITIDRCPKNADIKIKYQTYNDTAKTQDNDYDAKSGTVTFKKNNCSTEKRIYIKVRGDKKIEEDEKFYFKIQDNGTTNQDYDFGNTRTLIEIKNDDKPQSNKIDVGVWKSASKDRAQKNDTLTYYIGAYSNTDNASDYVIITDTIPSGLKILSIDKKGKYKCSKNGQKITCISKSKLSKNSYPEFHVRVKVITNSLSSITNTAKIRPKNLTDPNLNNNEDSHTLEILEPGTKDDVSIIKTVNNTTPNVYDIVTFRVTTTNIGYEKRIVMRDMFPRDHDKWGTTGGAFEFINSDTPSGVNCKLRGGSKERYLQCKTNKKYKDGQSFTINIKAKVLRGGHVCNTARGYEYNWKLKTHSTVCLDVKGDAKPILKRKIPNKTIYLDKKFSFYIKKYFKDPEGEKLTYEATNLPPGLQINKDSSRIWGKPTKLGTYKVNVKVSDPHGNFVTTSFIIKVITIKLKAIDDEFSTKPGKSITANFLDNDKGYKIKYVSHTNVSEGTLIVNSDGTFTYTPNSTTMGEVTFNYTIQDATGNTDSTTVTIKIETDYVDINETKAFELVNPPETRNLVGNYIILGNTSLCVTDKKSSFDSKCIDNKLSNNNNFMTKYIDIDGNSGIGAKTWNSSSSNFTLPDNFVENEGILWAGIFWQGGVNNLKTSIGKTNIQRRAYLDGNKIKYKNIDSNSSIKLVNTKANEILLKIDNDTKYTKVQATKFYIHNVFDVYGGYYSAYTDITQLIKSKKLKKGKHTITVANITSNEGIEKFTGNYAGWAVVIIYKQGDFTAVPRNISIYHGYAPLGNYVTEDKIDMEIKGFRLPKYGKVNAQFSVFSGEGEYLYGSGGDEIDEMVIRETSSGFGYSMPGAVDSTNIFDAKLANINRDSANYNALNNTNGIDIDTYDVSSILTNFRDKNKKIDKVYIGLHVKAPEFERVDYITPSMMAFSTQLYAPKLCYDYSAKLGETYNVEAKDRNLNLSNFLNKPLQIKVMIRSQEADFDIQNSKLYVTFDPKDVFKYKSAKVSVSNSHSYIDVDAIDAQKGTIPIGKDLSSNGGIISAKETIYSKIYYDFIKSQFKGKFDINLEGDISFDGKNYVHYQFTTAAPAGSSSYIERCPINPVYNPLYGSFNIERGDSKFNQSEAKRYSLKTQIVGVPYQISIASYKKDENGNYNKENKTNASLELDLIDGGTFENNSSAGYDSICQDPDSFARGVFVKLKNSSRVKLTIPQDYPDYPKNLALKNAIFRVWLLTTKVDNKNMMVNYSCSSQNDSKCFDRLYKDIYQNRDDKEKKRCLARCTNSSGSSCYDCLREYYSKPICSRDNFAIRPDSYYIKLSDNNETKSTNSFEISNNTKSDEAHIAAGYLYRLDINATKYNSKESATGYFFSAVGDNGAKKAILKFSDSANCTDRSDKDVKVTIINGSTHTYENKDNNNSAPFDNGIYLTNSGKYKLHIEDSSWTAIDQKDNPYKPFKNIDDCVKGSNNANASSLNGIRGCVTRSNSATFKDLAIEAHPYSFDVSSISIETNPNTAQTNYIYVNDLNRSKDKIKNDSVMALKVTGAIVAKSKDGTNLSNYKDGCSANNTNIKLSYTLDPSVVKDEKLNSVNLNYVLYQSSIDSQVAINKSSASPLNYNFAKRYFNTPATAQFSSYINFERHYDRAINPFKITVKDFNLTSSNDKLSVDLKSNYIPKGNKSINSNRVFYYAKVKSKSDLYDDITANSLKTPIEVTIFCNKSLQECQKYGIDTNKALTNEYDWWLAFNHNASANEGKAILKTDNTLANISPSTIDSFVNGVDKNVTVTYSQSGTRPAIIKIAPTQNMKDDFSWMLYNKLSDTPPPYIYKVRFVDTPASWSGKGKTGHTINVNSSGKKTNKVDW
jgi:hypothetical protein